MGKASGGKYVMRFDPSGLSQAFDRMRKEADKKGKSLMEQQGKFFLNTVKALAKPLEPTPDEIYRSAKARGFKIRRKKGYSVKKELQRRIRAIGTFRRGWKPARIEQSRNWIRVLIGNIVGYSGEVENKWKTGDKGADVVGGRFKQRLHKLAKQVTSIF